MWAPLKKLSSSLCLMPLRPARPTLTIGEKQEGRKEREAGGGEKKTAEHVLWGDYEGKSAGKERKEVSDVWRSFHAPEKSCHHRLEVYWSAFEALIGCQCGRVSSLRASLVRLLCVSSTMFVSVLCREHLVYENDSLEPRLDSRERRSGAGRSMLMLTWCVVNTENDQIITLIVWIII